MVVLQFQEHFLQRILPLDLLHRPGDDQPAALDDGDLVAQLLGDLQHMGGKEDGGAGIAQAAHDLLELVGGFGVKADKRLIHDKEPGLMDEGGNDGRSERRAGDGTDMSEFYNNNNNGKLDSVKGKAVPYISSVMVNINRENTNVILGDRCRTLWGKDYIEDSINGITFQISPLSFYQVNPVQTEKLYGKALEFAGLTGNEVVWDMYCGIGTISLIMATRAKKVYGVEIVPAAIENAKNNARINGLDNAEFYVGKSEEIAPELAEQGAVPDVIVVDPPRKGCDEALLDTIVKMQPERVVYVSCDSATLARDLKYLAARGYEVKTVQPVDQFCHTVHVECVTLLQRKDI